MDVGAKEKLAKLVKELRNDTSQKEFAKSLGVTYSAIQSWENAEVTPSSENLIRISKAAGYSLEELLSYLDGKPIETPTNVERLVAQIKSMPPKDLAIVARAVGDRLSAIAS
jgi:transcriptional regulator with XRE-family HTH domain